MSGTDILLLILGGVALLLWGCRMVRTGMMRAFGDELMRLLGAVAGNRLQAAMAGTVIRRIECHEGVPPSRSQSLNDLQKAL